MYHYTVAEPLNYHSSFLTAIDITHMGLVVITYLMHCHLVLMASGAGPNGLLPR